MDRCSVEGYHQRNPFACGLFPAIAVFFRCRQSSPGVTLTPEEEKEGAVLYARLIYPGVLGLTEANGSLVLKSLNSLATTTVDDDANNNQDLQGNSSTYPSGVLRCSPSLSNSIKE